ncbi:MAG: DNA polymerase I [Candidatus Kerfeldbacteria bacterium]|nr:DNA polymerase I [Candidatus Kerfeldbacteria bacterium]
MAQTTEKFVIFDGNAILHRAFHALPPLTTKDGVLVNAVYGFTNIFLKVLKDLKPQYVAVTFDRREPTFRHEAFKEYKAQRIKQPQELYDQIPLIKEVLAAFKVPIFEAAGFEADDIIGTLTLKVELDYQRLENVIVTGDMDTLQLINERTRVYLPKKGLSDPVLYDAAAVQARFGIKPAQLIEYKALRGDPSDNIPGIRGIGEKTALELVKQFGSISAMYAALTKTSPKKLALSARLLELLQASQAEAEMSRQLVTIVRNVPVKFKLADCRLGGFDNSRLVELFHKLEFKSLLGRLPELQTKLDLTPVPVKPTKQAKTKYHLIVTTGQLAAVIKKISQQKMLTVDTETTSLDPLQARLLGISLSFKPEEAYFVVFNKDLRQSPAGQQLKEILADKKVAKAGHNLKYDWQIMQRAGWPLDGLIFDTLLAAYLKQPGERNLDLKTLVFQELGHQMQTITELIGESGKNQKNMSEVPLAAMADYACADADYTGRLVQKLKTELEQANLWRLFQEIEMPLVPVLAQMELNGIKIDDVYLQKLNKQLAKQLQGLENEIYELSGHKFNINSPKQLKEILFDKLNIPSDGLRHTKTGISTAAAELEKMRGLHPVIDKLSTYRELAKLLSTYVEALPELINPVTGRVHTSFNQAITTTGRLTSSDPNLQNIPIRGDWGNKIRQAFVAEPGFKLLSADYSQIELRIAAHLAQDKKMIEVFNKGQDIHTATAAFIFGVKPAEVTPDQRRSAKEVNFGVLYGMGAWGLAERTGINREEARSFIERYFKSFTALAKWIEDTKTAARQQGFVTTWFGRRRYLPEINSGLAQMRNQAERMAINLPVQGTAADLLKIAMIKIGQQLSAISPTARLLLQVHDELVLEVSEAEVSQVAKFVKTEMEQAGSFRVPIVTEVKVGDNWGEMEPVVLSS